MESSVGFVIPFWGISSHRIQSHDYLLSVLMEHFKDWDPPAWGFERRYDDPMERSATRNVLAARALEQGIDILVFIDADSIPSPTALIESIGHVMRTKHWLFPYSTYYNLTEKGSEDFKENPPWKHWRPEDGYEYEYVFPGPDPYDRPPAVGGSVILHREVWEKVRGYDERFQGWGGEDRAFALALETLAGDSVRYPAPIYHLWHPAPENDRFGHPNWDYNRQLLERYQSANHLPARMHALVRGW